MLVALYATKKQLKQSIGQELMFMETSLFGAEFKLGSTVTVVGPTQYSRKFYAQVTIDLYGKIIKVK